MHILQSRDIGTYIEVARTLLRLQQTFFSDFRGAESHIKYTFSLILVFLANPAAATSIAHMLAYA